VIDFLRECCCTPPHNKRYMSKNAGPFKHRIDIQVHVHVVPYKDLPGPRQSEYSEAIRHRVIAARNTQLRRFFDEHIYSNAQMGPRLIRTYCALRPDCERIMENAVTNLGFSARGYDRILKVARTIADLEGAEDRE